MIQIARSGRTYPPVGRCIYCLSADDDLRREHIIPFGLGGNFVLPRASCRTCETITGRIEQISLRGMLGPLRTRLALPTRNKKERPQRLPLEIVKQDGSTETRAVEVQDFPQYLITFLMPPPGVLEGRERVETITLEPRLITSRRPEEPYTEWRTSLVVQPWAFLRMLAKIAHSFAVAEWGLKVFDTFTPLLAEIILSTSSYASHVIGGVADSDGTPTVLHWVHGHILAQEGREFLVVDICLFTLMKAPVFRVVVGERATPTDPT